jgi:hypothetical protein
MVGMTGTREAVMAGETIRQGTAVELWQGLLGEGEARAGCALGEEVQSYLVFALLRHLRDPHLLGRVLALEWLDAHERAGSQRVDTLRDVGDRCLLIAGLFPQQARRRRVDGDYFIALGRSAYGSAADVASPGYAALFGQLVTAYQAMVRVLSALDPARMATVGGGTMAAPSSTRPQGAALH